MCVGLIDAFVLMLFLGPIDEDDDLDDDDDLPPGMGMMHVAHDHVTNDHIM